MSNKYKVVGGSQSAHCCFEATVIDTTKPEMIGDKHYNNEYVAICECFEVTDAEDIVNALNSHDNLTEQIKMLREALELVRPDIYYNQDGDEIEAGGNFLIDNNGSSDNEAMQQIHEALSATEQK